RRAPRPVRTSVDRAIRTSPARRLRSRALHGAGQSTCLGRASKAILPNFTHAFPKRRRFPADRAIGAGVDRDPPPFDVHLRIDVAVLTRPVGSESGEDQANGMPR